MEKKLRIALVGCGGMGTRVHGPAFAEMPDAEIVAVCDIMPKNAADYGAALGLSADRICTDYRELLKMDGIDAVDIATPNKFHSEIAVAAMNAGKHVFCEKPDAINVQEVQKMKDAAESSGKILMVMRNNRYRETAQYLKKFIADGEMGEIYAGRCGWQRRRGIPGKGGWFTTKAISGGGPLIDLGVHMIDLAIYLMGNPRPITVSGCTYCKFANSDIEDSVNSSFGEKVENGTFDVEDLAMGFIRFDNGACLQIEFSWASNVDCERQFVELRGTKAGSKWETTDGVLRLYTENYGKTVDITPNVTDHSMGHPENLRHFVDCVLYGKQPMFVPQQGLDMVKVLEAMYRSAAEGKEIAL